MTGVPAWCEDLFAQFSAMCCNVLFFFSLLPFYVFSCSCLPAETHDSHSHAACRVFFHQKRAAKNSIDMLEQL